MAVRTRFSASVIASVLIPGSFGVFSAASKIGRVLEETANAVVLGDVVLAFGR